MSTPKPRSALITGASRGIGRACARALSREGVHVLIHYNSGEAEAETVVSEIRGGGGRADAVAANLSEPDAARALASSIGALVGGKLDVLVANAGAAKASPIEDSKIEDFDRLFAINVRASYFLFQQLLPVFSDSASIIMISSLAARAVVGQLSAYAATNGAIDTLVKHFAAAVGSRGIRVNAVAPGVIDTGLSSLTKTEEGRQGVLAMQALKRIGQAEDIADVVAFLASNAARFITGTTVHVDGGAKL
jgi:NAD(P)-dependent dehydrogenase (short-subunit alcohol dehydrogenase family)